jgi:hypothetical protein
MARTAIVAVSSCPIKGNMLFQQLRSIRSTHSAEHRQSKVGNIPVSDQIEWDGVGEGFNVSLQAPCSERPALDGSGSGRLRGFMKMRRVDGRNSFSQTAFERKRLRRNNDKHHKTPVQDSKFCSSDELNDTLSEKVTLSTKSSSFDVRRKVARYVLTSLLSDEDETMGPYQRNKVDGTTNDDKSRHTFLTKSGTECNVYENSLGRLPSYDDTIFDGIVEGITPVESITDQNIFTASTKGKVPDRELGKVDISTAKYWSNMDIKTCLHNGLIGVFQKTPENHTVTWQHKVVLSPLSY